MTRPGRPEVPAEKIAEALELRARGVSWSEVEVRLQVSRRTILRKTRRADRGQNPPEHEECARSPV